MKTGEEYGPSRWLEVAQERIDRFAETTEDRQWIHTDPAAAAQTPWGTTVAHGFLTLSLLPALLFEVGPGAADRVTINYGVDRVRFPAPVPAGSRIRASFRVDEVVPAAGGGEQARVTATVERKGSDRPVCVAELLFRIV